MGNAAAKNIGCIGAGVADRQTAFGFNNANLAVLVNQNVIGFHGF